MANQKEHGKADTAERPQTQTEQRKALMLEALEKSAGIVSQASAACGVRRRTHYEWLKNDPEYRAAVDDIRELIIDKAETTLLNAIESGDITATIFVLKTLGKRRGYSEKVDYEAIAKEAELRVLKADASIEREKRFSWL